MFPASSSIFRNCSPWQPLCLAEKHAVPGSINLVAIPFVPPRTTKIPDTHPREDSRSVEGLQLLDLLGGSRLGGASELDELGWDLIRGKMNALSAEVYIIEEPLLWPSAR